MTEWTVKTKGEEGQFVRICERRDGHLAYAIPTPRGYRCAWCKRGVFQAQPGFCVHTHCRVCNAEHWIGRQRFIHTPEMAK